MGIIWEQRDLLLHPESNDSLSIPPRCRKRIEGEDKGFQRQLRQKKGCFLVGNTKFPQFSLDSPLQKGGFRDVILIKGRLYYASLQGENEMMGDSSFPGGDMNSADIPRCQLKSRTGKRLLGEIFPDLLQKSGHLLTRQKSLCSAL